VPPSPDFTLTGDIAGRVLATTAALAILGVMSRLYDDLRPAEYQAGWRHPFPTGLDPRFRAAF